MKVWLATTLQRQYPAGKPGRDRPLRLVAARGERVSFQACCYIDADRTEMVSARATAPKGLRASVRRVGAVPMPHHNTNMPLDDVEGWDHVPGLVPDPLYPDTETLLGPREVCTFWVTVEVSRTARPGPKKVAVHLELGEKQKTTITCQAVVEVARAVLDKNKRCLMTHWFSNDCIAAWHKMEPFTRRYWPIVEKYMRNFADHGNTLILVPAFTPPTDGDRPPTQLVGVKSLPKGKYSFDWHLVKRYVDLARKSGLRGYLWNHFFSQWGAANAIRIFEGRGDERRLLWPKSTGATSATYRNFLSQYLPALKRFLDAEGIAKKSYFCLSDEPHGDAHLKNYGKARALLREYAPWLKVCDAPSDTRFAKAGLTDMPIPGLTAAPEFIKEGIPCWTYYCCGPRGYYINRMLDTPLTKIRMTGWVLYRLGIPGFLHWGYNYWFRLGTHELIDPYTVSDGLRWPLIPHGDTFVVYPGADGPIDSLRWEVFAESMQDYALLNTLAVDRNARSLASITDFKDFPRDPSWVPAARRKLLARA